MLNIFVLIFKSGNDKAIIQWKHNIEDGDSMSESEDEVEKRLTSNPAFIWKLKFEAFPFHFSLY